MCVKVFWGFCGTCAGPRDSPNGEASHPGEVLQRVYLKGLGFRVCRV